MQAVAAAQAPTTRSPHHGHLHTAQDPTRTDTDTSHQAPASLPLLTYLIHKDVSLEGETKKQNQSNKGAGHSLPVTAGSPAGVGQGETPPPPGPWGPNSFIIPLPPGIKGASDCRRAQSARATWLSPVRTAQALVCLPLSPHALSVEVASV